MTSMVIEVKFVIGRLNNKKGILNIECENTIGGRKRQKTN
jgi:hypothetical protein